MNRQGLGLIFVFLLLFGFVLVSLTAFNNMSLLPSQKLTLGEVIGWGDLNTEHETLVQEIKKDLSITREVKILIGPYYDVFGYASLIDIQENKNYYIFLDESFYAKLLHEERRAMVAHELGHLKKRFSNKLAPDSEQILKNDIEADTYATKYVYPKVMMSLLEKAKNDSFLHFFVLNSKEYKARIQNLEKLQREFLQKH